MNKTKLLKLARLLKCIKEKQTDKGLLIVEDEFEPNVEVFVTDENGDLIPAMDGLYEAEDVLITIEGGVIKEIKLKEPEVTEEVKVEEELEGEEEVVVEEEPTNELETRVKTLEDEVAKLIELINKLYEMLEKPVEEPVEVQETVEMKKQAKRQRGLDFLAQAFKK